MTNPAAPTEAFRAGTGAPLVLLHMGANPEHKWEPILPALTGSFEVLIPTLPGWRGGQRLAQEATIDGFVEAIERAMDDAGWSTAHIAGNSLGGWLAFELARRGRARSVCAISPGGGWDDRGARRQLLFFLRNHRLTRVLRPLVGVVLKSGYAREAFFELLVERPRDLTAQQAADLARDTMVGQVPHIVRGIAAARVTPFPVQDVPAVLAWAENDRFTRLHPDADTWRRAAPWAEFHLIRDAGHLAMYDNPTAVESLIREVAGR